MDWMSFSDKMKQVACRLSKSACPMVLVLPDGREIRFTDINVDMFDYKGKRGDIEYTSIGFKVNLLGAEVTDVQDDGSLANSPFGNGAKMREALEQIAKLMDGILVRTELDDETHRIALEAQNMADGALSPSPRNCDVGTAEEQHRRHDAFCDATRNGMSGYHCDDAPRCVFCFSKWAQMPYEEGGKK